MKKLTALLLIAATLLLTLAACGKPYTPLPNPSLVLGEKYLTDLDYEQALLQFDQAIIVEPKNPRGYLGKADALLHLDRQSDAVQTLDSGAKATRGDTRKALANAKTEAEKSPVDGYIGLSSAYEKLGWKEIAVALVKRVCEELPEESRLKVVLEHLLNTSDTTASTEKNKAGTDINGYGEKEYPEGIYKGNFVNGKREGQGELTYTCAQSFWFGADYDNYNVGDVYKGQWRNDLRDGSGMRTLIDGSSVEANYREDKLHGAYKSIDIYGTTTASGQFENGRLAGQMDLFKYGYDQPCGHTTYEYSADGAISKSTTRYTKYWSDWFWDSYLQEETWEVENYDADNRLIRLRGSSRYSDARTGILAHEYFYREDGTLLRTSENLIFSDGEKSDYVHHFNECGQSERGEGSGSYSGGGDYTHNWTQHYDTNGRRTQREDHHAYGSGADNITTYFNAHGQEERKELVHTNNPDDSKNTFKTIYQYDATGRPMRYDYYWNGNLTNYAIKEADGGVNHYYADGTPEE